MSKELWILENDQIIRNYDEGVITYELALELLIAQGLDKDDAEAELESEESFNV